MLRWSASHTDIVRRITFIKCIGESYLKGLLFIKKWGCESTLDFYWWSVVVEWQYFIYILCVKCHF